ncbi:MAG TPA: hypothetical protein VFD92_03205 [Candidatus Binatia bacterium]|nr:hypothetical protein [Candidatus Binatia bacterium]
MKTSGESPAGEKRRARRGLVSGATPRRLAQAVVTVVAASALGTAAAAPITDPADPALGGAPITVDFESAAPGIYPAYAGGLSVQTADGVASFVGARLAVSSTYAGQYNTTGQYVSSEGYLFRNLIITFPSPVKAFGMNVGLTDQPWDLQAYDAAGGLIESVTVPALLGSNAGDFFGISSSTEIAQAILVVQLPVKPGPLWAVVDNVKFPSKLVAPTDPADLEVHVPDRPLRSRVGRRITYRVTTSNHGPAIATGARLVVSLAGVGGSDLASIAAPSECVVSGATATCALGDLAPGRRKRIAISLVPSVPGTVSAIASATSAAPDPTPADATDRVDTTVLP